MSDDRMTRFGVSPRLAVTVAIGVLLAVAVALVRVPTSLGVKVPEPATFATEPDMTVREYIWRVWWRARDDLIDVDPQWLVTAGLIALLVVFAAGTLLAIWLVSGVPADEDIARADG